MAISMKAMVLLAFCVLMSRQSYAEAEVTGEEWCKAAKLKYSQFRIKHAIRVGEYIGLKGVLKNHSNEQETLATTIRVQYWHQPDPSHKTQYNYYSATLWPDLDSEIEIRKPLYVMSVPKIYILEEGNEHEMGDTRHENTTLLLVGKEGNPSPNVNLTYALTFKYSEVENLGNGSKTVETIDKKGKVFDPIDGIDNSKQFSVKFLFAHFPEVTLIKAVLPFLLTTKQGGIDEETHFAIVYTEEKLDGKPIYYKHFMTSHGLEVDGDPIKYLDWTFDGNQDYCDRISPKVDEIPNAIPDAVVFIRSESSGKNQVVFFLEFYDTNHKLIKLTYNRKSYKIKEVGNLTSNYESLLHCDPHPAFKPKEPKKLCKKEDYDNLEEDALPMVDESQTATTLLHWIAILITIAAIIGLISVVIYSIVANKQKDPK